MRRPLRLTYEQGEEDVLGALDGEVDWTAVPGAQEAQAEHMHLHEVACFGGLAWGAYARRTLTPLARHVHLDSDPHPMVHPHASDGHVSTPLGYGLLGTRARLPTIINKGFGKSPVTFASVILRRVLKRRQ